MILPVFWDLALPPARGSDPFFNTLSTPEIAQFEERMTDQSEQPTGTLAQDDLEAVRRLRDAFDSIKKQLARVIVGQDKVIVTAGSGAPSPATRGRAVPWILFT